jgi:hypothetical protein
MSDDFENDVPEDVEQVDDAFEPKKLGNPSISWEGVKVGTEFEFELLEIQPGKAHLTTPVMKFGTREIDRFKNGNPKKQIEVVVKTNLKDYALTSLDYQEKAELEGREDDGVRRLFLKHPNMQEFVETVQASGAKVPEVGAKGTVKLAKRKPNPGFKPSNILAFTYVRPTADVPFKV